MITRQPQSTGKAWIALHVIAIASLGCYWTLGFRTRIERLLHEVSQEAQRDLNRSMLDDPGRNIPALILSVVIGSVATAAGVGGGAFFVPLFNVLLQFSVKGATALSQATIAGGGIAGVAVTLHKKHPYDPNRSLIDFDLALMLLPVLLLGVALGVLGNVLFPSWLITILLLLLLLFLTERTVRKAISLHRAEKQYLAQAQEEPKQDRLSKRGQPAQQQQQQPQRAAGGTEAAGKGNAESGGTENRRSQDGTAGTSGRGKPGDDAAGAPDEEQGLGTDGGVQRAAGGSSSGEGGLQPGASNLSAFDGLAAGARPSSGLDRTDSGSEHGDEDGSHQQGGQQQQPPQGWVNIVVLVTFWCIFVAFQALLSRWPRCSAAYWAIFSVQAALCLAAECIFIHLVHKRKAAARRTSLQQPILARVYKEPPAWTLSRLTRSALITLVAGFIAGLLGIGGGMIIGPLLLEFGTHPHVAAATSTLMVLFSASSAALSFGFGHHLNLQFALTFGLACMAASLVGVLLVNRVIARSGKASIIVFLLAMIIGTGVTLTAAFGGRFAIQDLIHHRNLSFSSLCH